MDRQYNFEPMGRNKHFSYNFNTFSSWDSSTLEDNKPRNIILCYKVDRTGTYIVSHRRRKRFQDRSFEGLDM